MHCSATRDDRAFSWADIRSYHKSRGWVDIGYHFGIELVGSGYEVAIGRMPNEKGAHCVDAGMNSKALGICFVGNFDRTPPPLQQWLLGLRLVRSLCETMNIPFDHIHGHREFNPNKTCPGIQFNVEKFKQEVRV